MEEKIISRIGISIPNNLLTKLDSVLESRGYCTRSDAIRGLVRDYIDEYDKTENIENGREIGTVSFIYDRTVIGISDKILEEYHGYNDILVAASRTHINEESCFEIVTLRGDSGKIRNLMGALMGIKGVSRVKIAVSKITE